MHHYILTLQCPDQPGIVKALATGIGECGGNILTSAQSSDEVTGVFVMRVTFETAQADEAIVRNTIESAVGFLHPKLTLRPATRRRKAIIMVSKYDHCLREILYLWRNDELALDIPVIVSNHEDLRHLAANNGIPFEYIPVTRETKADAEARLLALVEEHQADFVVLARYMQVLSDAACAQLPGRVINIHHSFLPGFKGAKPYHQAYERGVKIIGATAHFVTADLDEGPIIEQDVERVTHAHTPDQLAVVGRDIERKVLSRALTFIAEDRVFLVGHRTTVFPQ